MMQSTIKRKAEEDNIPNVHPELSVIFFISLHHKWHVLVQHSKDNKEFSFTTVVSYNKEYSPEIIKEYFDSEHNPICLATPLEKFLAKQTTVNKKQIKVENLTSLPNISAPFYVANMGNVTALPDIKPKAEYTKTAKWIPLEQIKIQYNNTSQVFDAKFSGKSYDISITPLAMLELAYGILHIRDMIIRNNSRQEATFLTGKSGIAGIQNSCTLSCKIQKQIKKYFTNHENNLSTTDQELLTNFFERLELSFDSNNLILIAESIQKLQKDFIVVEKLTKYYMENKTSKKFDPQDILTILKGKDIKEYKVPEYEVIYV